MIRKSGNRLSEKIMPKQRHMSFDEQVERKQENPPRAPTSHRRT
jgi:hypothetical protein